MFELAGLTHLGLEPLWELGPQAVKLQAHFGIHPDAHVVVHDLGLRLQHTQIQGMISWPCLYDLQREIAWIANHTSEMSSSPKTAERKTGCTSVKCHVHSLSGL